MEYQRQEKLQRNTIVLPSSTVNEYLFLIRVTSNPIP